MKTFGLKTFYLQVTLISALVVLLIFLDSSSPMYLALGIPLAMTLGQALYSPVIRISTERLSVFTLMPFNRNINLQLPDIEKIKIEINQKMRFILHMKDGTIVSTICSRYAYDMKPLYRALYGTGIPIESEGIGSIDWVKPD